MKRMSSILTLLMALPAFAHNHTQHKSPPHLDLEMTSIEYRQHLAKTAKLKFNFEPEPHIEETIALGTRLSEWIEAVNSTRSQENAIRLTSAATRRGIPIDKPNIYSPKIISADLMSALKEMPQAVKDILFNPDSLPSTLPVDDETFILHARKLNRIYQSAARYKSLIPYKEYYIEAAKEDVRGYHYLTTNNITADSLKEVSAIDPAKVQLIKEALVQICQNSGVNQCSSLLQAAFENNALADFYNRYFPAAKETWKAFFHIPDFAVRTDVSWTDSIMSVPFNTPSVTKFIPYLQNNIEEEFRFEVWGLKLNFGEFENGPRLTFKAGEVPHVDRLGGNQIVMDSNQPIEEYESQWTIRHEFGHVIGLPDCYHEFYDENLNAFVNYQLDITDLMCSRAGNMNERIYKELESVYKK